MQNAFLACSIFTKAYYNMFRIEFLFSVNGRKKNRPYKIGKARKCNRTITKAILSVVGQSGYGCLDAYVHALVDSWPCC